MHICTYFLYAHYLSLCTCTFRYYYEGGGIGKYLLIMCNVYLEEKEVETDERKVSFILCNHV